MTAPTAPISLPNLTAPIPGAAQQPASVAFLPFIPEQDKFIKALISFFHTTGKVSRQDSRLRENLFSNELHAPAEEVGWLGGAYGILELLLRKNAISRPLKLNALCTQPLTSAETLFKAPMKYPSGVVEEPWSSAPQL